MTPQMFSLWKKLYMNNKKRKQIFLNGIILAAVTAGLCVYFTLEGIWGIAQAIIIIFLSAVSGFQFWLYKTFFKE